MSALDVPALLGALEIRGEARGDHIWALCPDPLHKDTSASWRIRDEPGVREHGSHHCFSCGFGGGPWELVSAVRNLALEEAARWLSDWRAGAATSPASVDLPAVRVALGAPAPSYQLPEGVRIPTLDGSRWFPGALRYLRSRDVPGWQIRRWSIGYAVEGELAFRVVIPVVSGGRLVAHVARAWIKDGRARYDMPSKSDGALTSLALFGDQHLDPSPAATVCEGSFKALALERAGAPNPRAVLGVQSITPAKLAMLSRFPVLLVAPDPDAAGEALLRKLSPLGRRAEIRVLDLRHSPDDYLTSGEPGARPEDLRAALIAAADSAGIPIGPARTT